MFSDFAAAQKKLQGDIEQQKEKARLKAEKNKAIIERQRQRQVQREEEARQRRLRENEQAEADRLAHESEIESNGGVYWHGRLRAIPAPEDIATSKGIKRAADKILLPPSAGNSLLHQDAMKNGAYFFELKHPNGRRTHAGLLDFTAAEGFVALPRKVYRCLYGIQRQQKQQQNDVNAGEEEEREGAVAVAIEVAYRRLPKGTKVVFQPRSATFQQSMEGEDIREKLEDVLLRHSALTVGDWLQVGTSQGEVLELRVKELEPADAVSVIDTEMVAEVHPSVETEEKIAAEEAEARRQWEAVQAKARAEEEERVAAAEEAVMERDRVERAMEAARAMLPPEPESESEPVKGGGGGGAVGVVTAVVRFPDGSRHSRRVKSTHPVKVLFDFADAMGGVRVKGPGYRLVTQFPRSVFEREAHGGTLVGEIVGGNERSIMLFVEPIV